jgi:predicted Zn-dependent protease
VKRKILILCVALLCAGLWIARTGRAITLAEEEKLGEEFMRMAKRQYRMIDDPAIVGCVEKIGARLMAALAPQPFEYHFHVIQEDSFNAFAGPAGHVFIHSGLLAALESESELAGILAHEIAHVTCRHISDNIDRSSRLRRAGLGAGILVAAAGSIPAAD